MLKKPQYFFLAFIFIIFSLLLYKDIFSDRTLVPNLEPYPDTLHYINSAQSFIKGYGFSLTREGRSIGVNVPPLYSTTLLPFFLVSKDPRVFYFLNAVLAFSSVYLLFLILKKITPNMWIITLTLFLFVTNYFIYWVPTLAMAENLIIPLFLASILLLLDDINSGKIFIAAILAIIFYATKYASITLLVTFSTFYLAKLLIFSKDKLKNVSLFTTVFIFFGTIFLISEYVSKGNNIFGNWLNIALNFLSSTKSLGNSTASNSGWFSINYIRANLPVYLKSLTGQPIRFLWVNDSLVPSFIAIPALTGLFIGIFNRKFKFIAGYLLTFLILSILFISTFYSLDGRYIFEAIPSLLLGFSLFLSTAYGLASKNKNFTRFFYIFIFGILILYLYFNGQRLKNQIALNLRHAETPWYYVSVLQLNNYFNQSALDKKPVVISALPPYFVDFYSNGNYSLLPLSREQEFPGRWEKVWGPNDYSDLPTLYTKYIKSGYSIYVDKYGLGNVAVLHRDFNIIQNKFKLNLVKEGCYGECNIYKVGLKIDK